MILHEEKLVLVHGDITEDHLYFTQRNIKNEAEKWTVSALIDFGDARIAPEQYEWIPLWFGAFQRNTRLYRQFMVEFTDDKIEWESFYGIMSTMTLLHEFGLEIIKDVIQQSERKITDFDSLHSIMKFLWNF